MVELAQRREPEAAEIVHHRAPPFPRAVRTFTGRQKELARALALLDKEVLFLVYGVSGIGKSEFVYKLIEQARATAPWDSAQLVLVTVGEDHRAEHLTALLRLHTGLLRAHDTALDGVLLAGRAPSLQDELAEIVAALNARPFLVFIDDMHNLDTATSARLLRYLSRYVQRSRIFVASRLEIPLPLDTSPPVVTRLPALDPSESVALVDSIAYRLGVPVPDGRVISQRARGNPLLVQLALSGAQVGTIDPLCQSLRSLGPMVRRVLLLATVMRARCALRDLLLPGEPAETVTAATQELGRRFLIHIEDAHVTVPEMIKMAMVEHAGEGELREARRDAAELHTRRFNADPRAGLLDCIEAVHHLVVLGDAAAAWALIERGYPRLAAANLDPLLTEPLAALRALPGIDPVQVGTLLARILLHAGKVGEARRIIEPLLELPAARRSPACLCLAAEVTHRSGLSAQAEALLRSAGEVAADPQERLLTRLQLADTLSLNGDGLGARALLQEARAELAERGSPLLVRWHWSQALSYLFEHQHTAAAAAAATGRAQLVGEDGRADALLLALLEVLALVGCDDVAGARRLIDQELAPAVAAGLLPEYKLQLYRGVVLAAEGDVRAASEILESSYSAFRAHGDMVYATIAGYYLGAALLKRGLLRKALPITDCTVGLAFAGGLASTHPLAQLQHAHVLLSAGEVTRAHKYMTDVLAAPRIAPLALGTARRFLATVHWLQDDAAASRRALATARATAALCTEPAQVHLLACELGEMEFINGDAELLIRQLEPSVRYYAERERPYMEARASIVLALGYLGRGSGADDLLRAEQALARARTLSEQHGYVLLRLRCALLECAVAVRRGDTAQAERLLRAAQPSSGDAAGVMESGLLRSALAYLAGEGVAAPHDRLLQFIGLRPSDTYELVERGRCRGISGPEAERLRGERELVVEPDRGVVIARGQKGVLRRPLVAAILARLVEQRDTELSAEQLYKDVWDSETYHPLRHRNQVYVAINRVRGALRELLPERTVVETLPQGWRLSQDVDVCVIRPRPTKPQP